MAISESTTYISETSRFTTALCLSVALHLLLMLGIQVNPSDPEIKPLRVKLVAPPKRDLSQHTEPRIVSPSKAPEVPQTPNTTQLSDKNRFVAKQQIKRGTLTPAPVAQSQPSIIVAKQQQANKTEPKTSPKSTQSRNTLKSPTLRLAPQELAKTISVQKHKSQNTKTPRKPKEQNELKLSHSRMLALLKARPFQRMMSQNQALKSAGVPDYLPDIPDGDITLLNAKADRFAIFVRRVALQVFGAIRQKNWQEIPINEIHRLRRFTTIHAIMNPKGELLSVELSQSSGSRPFDIVVNASAQKGTWDQNPPKGAEASDGNIHFIFKARSWARSANQGMGEQRWLLLGTGLL